jgi:hypothetical protein
VAAAAERFEADAAADRIELDTPAGVELDALGEPSDAGKTRAGAVFGRPPPVRACSI